MSRNCDAVDWGSTQWCSLNRHERCEYRIGGRLEHGNWVAECWITMPNERGHGRHWPAGRPRVIRPSHLYRCDCRCHVDGEQMVLEMGA